MRQWNLISVKKATRAAGNMTHKLLIPICSIVFIGTAAAQSTGQQMTPFRGKLTINETRTMRVNSVMQSRGEAVRLTSTLGRFDAIPQGYVGVIEFVTVNCFTAYGRQLGISFAIDDRNDDTSVRYDIALASSLALGSSQTDRIVPAIRVYSASQPVRVYAGAGDEVKVRYGLAAQVANENDSAAEVTISCDIAVAGHFTRLQP